MDQALFDLHMHPLYKRFITKWELEIPSKQSPIDLRQRIILSNPVMKLSDIFLRILGSQSAIADFKSGNVKIAVAALCGIEFGFAAGRGCVGKLLQSQISQPLDPLYFKNVQLGKLSYFHLMLKELDLYRVLQQSPDIEFLCRKKSQTQINKLKKETVSSSHFIALSIEGAHNFNRYFINNPTAIDRFEYAQEDPIINELKAPDAAGFSPSEGLQRFMQLLWNIDMDMMYITMTHLTHQGSYNVATHSFGLKLLEHNAFYPLGCGITHYGYELIDACYQLQLQKDASNDMVAAPVLIDIKHLSLQSRMDFYKYRKEKGYQLPIVASHMGVTGYTIKEWKEALIQKSCKLRTSASTNVVELEIKRQYCCRKNFFFEKAYDYNAWSINLMDEDIIEIMDSEGLIGMSLDVRILGHQDYINFKATPSEFLSIEEFKTHFNIDVKNLPKEPLKIQESFLEKEESVESMNHTKMLCFNIIHIVVTAYRFCDDSINPWKHICIGSDFDGLIEPALACENVTETASLKLALIKMLKHCADAYQEMHGNILKLNVFLAEENNIKMAVEDILYNNGKNFIIQWLQGFSKK